MKKRKKSNLRIFWSRLWKLVGPLQKKIKNLAFLIVLFELSRLLGPYILKLVIDTIISFNPEKIKDLLLLILLLFSSNELVAFIDYFLDKYIVTIIAEAERFLPVNAHKKMLSLSLAYHEKENTGNKVSKIDRGVDKIVNLLGNFFWDVAPTIIQVILTAITLFFVDYRFGLVFVVFAPAFAILSLRANKQVYPSRKARQDEYEESSGMMAQAIININTVKSFVQEEKEERIYQKIRDKIKINVLNEYGLILKYNLGRNLIIDLGRISVLLLGVYFVWNNSITLGSLVFIITISDKALISLFRISRLYDRIMESSEAIERLYLLDKQEISIKNPANGYVPEKITGQIEFVNLDFSYDNNIDKALVNVNQKINSGCTTALIGPSGGGKTTLARMIYRHYDPQKGAVLLDGKDLRDYDLKSFRKHIAIVPQEVEIFSTSVWNNISYGKPTAAREGIEAAARIANAEEFIEKLPEKYKTEVGERGIKLSGGQRQRIGIARAILANPRILIFDEATSNLDSYSEKLIQSAMDKVSRGRTVIIIAHRLSTIKKADKIIVLEQGRVVEEGSHSELANTKGGLYSKLLNLQQMGDVE
jgi:ABC-type multidrug transport system fused ATPase/permease subunit